MHFTFVSQQRPSVLQGGSPGEPRGCNPHRTISLYRCFKALPYTGNECISIYICIYIPGISIYIQCGTGSNK